MILSFFLFFFMLFRRRSGRTAWPPGPWTMPIIGSLHHFLRGTPHHIVTELSHKHGPLMHLRLGQLDVIVASSTEMAKAITMTHDTNFAFRPDLIAGRIITYNNVNISLAPYGGYWRQMRKLCMVELLNTRRVKAMHPIRAQEFFNLFERIAAAAGSAVNFTQEMFTFANTMTAKATFGMESKHGQRFISASKRSLELGSAFNLAELFPSVSFIERLTGLKARTPRVHQEMDQILDDIIETHEAMKKSGIHGSSDEGMEKEGILDVMWRIKAQGDLEIPLTMDNVKSVLLDMYVGGTDTTAMTLTWAMTELIRNPKVMQKAQEEVRHGFKGKSIIDEEDIKDLHYLKLVIKETMRLHMPVPFLIPRESSEACKIGDYEIPAGTRVLINAWGIGRDPKYWDNPESFMPERFDGNQIDFKGTNYEFLPFGAGRRICPGIGFGVANLEFALAHLLFYFNWELPAGVKPEDLDMTEILGLTAAKKLDVYLIATPYASLPKPID
ncbi:hypothetical protein J5N97_022320 [Dioscorea zingiberensis]|uniref:Cytochrome P450 n=1 Tax=Dioscorea zingiberensis TaxID=325984 RepID=A0A9D5CAZ7_9LILI|nr:hypothetical protein J5N97_022320 [Dioscorea zingiberensis]